MKKVLIFFVVLTAMSLISGISRVQGRGISGQVTDSLGNGLANVYVAAYDYNSDNWIKGSSTDSDGNYSLSMPAGTYKIQFVPSPSGGFYSPQWYDGKSNSVVADLVTVKGFQTTLNINAQLDIGGTISGRVTDVSGNGIPNVYIGAPDLYGNWTNGCSTDTGGNYSFNLPAGTYKVHFSLSSSSGYYAPEWFGKKSNSFVADLVTVTALQTTSNINAQLATGGKISGRVTGPSGRGIRNIFVYAADPDFSYWIDGSTTDSNGNYSLNAPAGTWKVHFSSSPSTANYAPEWYDNKNYFQVGDLVTVVPGKTTFNVNAWLEIGGTISGRVTDTTANGIAGVYVQPYDLNDDTIIFNGATTNSEGSYTIPLRAGSYKVGFSLSPGAPNFASEWYNNKNDFQSADSVMVKKLRKTSIDAQLGPSAP